MTKQRLSAADRRARTLHRVTKVFAQKGFAGTTSATLAQAAGVSEGMLYKLFGSKQKLYAAMIEHKLADAGWGEFPTGSEDSAALDEAAFFTGLAQAIFDKVEADPDFVRLLLYSDLQGGEFATLFQEAMGEAVINAVSAYVNSRVEAGALRAVDADVAGTAFLCMTWQYAVCTRVFPFEGLPQRSSAEIVQTLVTIFLKGLRS